jgi:Peptidase propeptide and YPEB domain
MPTIRQIVFFLVFGAGVLSSGQALADRAPRPEERSRIETMLRNEGFTRWGKIELDDEDDVWAVDDAHASDGNSYDLLLHPDTLAIIAREPHDE